MVMGRDQAGVDNAAGCIDDLLIAPARKGADGRNAAVADADPAACAHGPARQPGENTPRPLDESHVSAPTSLSCQFPSASLERPTIPANRPTPASVMRRSAANMRGM